jgi:hypothetical protein
LSDQNSRDEEENVNGIPVGHDECDDQLGEPSVDCHFSADHSVVSEDSVASNHPKGADASQPIEALKSFWGFRLEGQKLRDVCVEGKGDENLLWLVCEGGSFGTNFVIRR